MADISEQQNKNRIAIKEEKEQRLNYPLISACSPGILR